jgi:RNA polymerase sigma-70 factor (ECF subfamily)
MTFEVESEAEIVRGLRRSEAVAFDALYTLFRARIHGFLLRLTGRRDVAEDLFQETWLNVARAAPRLREDTRLAPWLFTIARNQWVSHRRWSMLDVSRLVTLGDDAHFAASEPAPDDALATSREVARIERAIGALPASLREALLLVGVEGFDQKEAAAILGVTHDTMRQRVTRAREKLGALVGAEEAAHAEEAARQRSGVRSTR